MTDGKTVIDNLQIIATWAAVGKDPIYKGIESKCCEDVEQWTMDAIELIKEQEEKIRELESMNVTASGNGVAIGSVRGGLVIHKQTAKEIHNIKHVDVLNV